MSTSRVRIEAGADTFNDGGNMQQSLGSVVVVVPVFDRRCLLERALASVACQTVLPREVVVVDDGSTDGSHEVALSAAMQVLLLRQPNRGVSAARNAGVASTEAQWIAFLDSDDEWHPEKLERQLAALAGRPELGICHTDEIWIRDGRRVNPRRVHRKEGGRLFRQGLERCVVSPSSVIVRRDLFEAEGGFDESLPACEDYDLWLRLCRTNEVLLVPEQLVTKYGGHDGQLSRLPGLDRYRIRALEKLLRLELEEEDRVAVVKTLCRKIGVYAPGARKRGRVDEASVLEERAAALRGALS